MNRLLNIGFSYVGNWTLNNLSRLSLTLSSHYNSKNILYSFISNGEIKYIGKSIQTLESRLYGYQNPGSSQSTNIRVNKLLVEQLQKGYPVDIFILNDNGLLNFGGFNINIAAGLEDSLIFEINPDWNYSGKKRIKEDKQSEDVVLNKAIIKKEISTVKDRFDIKLGQTYFNQGFFNVPVSHSHLFAEDSAVIELILGQTEEQIYGYINRRANKNNCPRIMGGISLKQWIQQLFKQDEIMMVTILSTISIKLTRK
jgi:hypothetical protein